MSSGHLRGLDSVTKSAARILLCLAVAGCGAAHEGDGDLGVDGRPDLGAVDLAPPADLEPSDMPPPPDLMDPGLCPNTRASGTCAEAFFRGVAACFPTSGACKTVKTADAEEICWDDGSDLLATFHMATTSFSGTWTAGGKTCMVGQVSVAANGGRLFNLTVGNSTLVYDEDSGRVTCPDGSVTNIGSNDGNCVAIRDILNPNPVPCVEGTCP